MPELRVEVRRGGAVVRRGIGPVGRIGENTTVDRRADLIFQLQLHVVLISLLRGGPRNTAGHGAGALEDILGGRLGDDEALSNVGLGRVDLGEG